MAITLSRVDDRVIHGQTTTRWTKARPVQGILVVGDAIAANELRVKVLKAAAGDLKLGVYKIADAADKIRKGMESDKNFFLISDSPQVFAKLTELGVNYGSVLNIGCMNTREGAVTVGRTVAIDEADAKAFDYLSANGITLEFQLLPSDAVKGWSEIKAKYESAKKQDAR